MKVMRSHIKEILRGESPNQRYEDVVPPDADGTHDRRNDINGSTNILNLEE
jgi:hypothetical protein